MEKAYVEMQKCLAYYVERRHDQVGDPGEDREEKREGKEELRREGEGWRDEGVRRSRGLGSKLVCEGRLMTNGGVFVSGRIFRKRC